MWTYEDLDCYAKASRDSALRPLATAALYKVARIVETWLHVPTGKLTIKDGPRDKKDPGQEGATAILELTGISGDAPLRVQVSCLQATTETVTVIMEAPSRPMDREVVQTDSGFSDQSKEMLARGFLRLARYEIDARTAKSR